jgi:hypothetical protein
LTWYEIGVSNQKWKKKALRKHAPQLWLTQDPRWDSFSSLFWPISDKPISWPPPQHLGDDITDEFVNRFASLGDATLSRGELCSCERGFTVSGQRASW